MFPPPVPWKQITSADPSRQYVAFTSCFFLKSPLRAVSFLARSLKIMKQADTAPGIVGWSLGPNLPTLEFYTLSAWEDDAALKAFIKSADHGVALKQFEHDLRKKSIFVHYKVLGRDLPLTWPDALERQKIREASSPPS
jgi:heme-degrading monooxygenase HmoA